MSHTFGMDLQSQAKRTPSVKHLQHSGFNNAAILKGQHQGANYFIRSETAHTVC